VYTTTSKQIVKTYEDAQPELPCIIKITYEKNTLSTYIKLVYTFCMGLLRNYFASAVTRAFSNHFTSSKGKTPKILGEKIWFPKSTDILSL
jgi:hypothetical protein